MLHQDYNYRFLGCRTTFFDAYTPRFGGIFCPYHQSRSVSWFGNGCSASFKNAWRYASVRSMYGLDVQRDVFTYTFISWFFKESMAFLFFFKTFFTESWNYHPCFTSISALACRLVCNIVSSFFAGKALNCWVPGTRFYPILSIR